MVGGGIAQAIFVSQQALLALPDFLALVYVLAALFIEQAITAGCGQGQVNLVVNLLPALVFQVLWLFAGPIDWTQARRGISARCCSAGWRDRSLSLERCWRF